tara:strand:- start:1938 stop:2165 length:228 start_codon:yes stop_codon:yes gene_type:complete
MSIILKITLEELELLIEVMERNRNDSDDESRLRQDLKNIRISQEEKINREAEQMQQKPSEEVRLIPNPTSAEHIE